jgi:hypothetical protein
VSDKHPTRSPRGIEGKHSADSKVTGANALIREYAKSAVSPGHLAASTASIRDLNTRECLC